MSKSRSSSVLVFHAARVIVAFLCAVAFGFGLSQYASAQTPTTLTGTFDVTYGDPVTLYSLTDNVDARRATQLVIDPAVLRRAGGVAALNGKRVNVNGAPLGANRALGRAATASDAFEVSEIRLALGANVVPLAVNGSQAYLNLLCKFNDISSEPHAKAHYDTLLGIGANGTTVPSLDNYFRDSSYGAINLNGSVTTNGWRSLPHPMSHYGDGTNTNADISANLKNMAQDCAAAWDPDINFAPFVGLNVVLNGDVFLTAWGGRKNLVLDGSTRSMATTWFNVTYGERFGTWAHEMGHALGLHHSGSDSGVEYQNAYDVMGKGSYAAPSGQPFVVWPVHTIAPYKQQLGWIPWARQFQYNGESGGTITLEELGATTSSNYLMARIPHPDNIASHYYTVEFRKKVGSYENQLPITGNGAVIIHEVDTTRSVPALVQGNLASSGGNFTNDAAYQWLAGEIWTGAGNINVQVNSISASSANIRIFTGCTVPARASMETPAPGSTLTATSMTFTWNHGCQVESFHLKVGTTGAGSSNLLSQTVNGTSRTVANLPNSGTLYVRLTSYIQGDSWQYDYTYTMNVPTPPTNPSLSSPSHQVKVASADRTIDITWPEAGRLFGASSAGSTIDGYSWSFTQAAGDTPDTTKDGEEGATGTTSSSLAKGSWWFHLRTRDNAGIWSTPTHLGPFVIQ